MSEEQITSLAFSQEDRSSTRKNPLFSSLQGLLWEPEVAFRIVWNPWINSSSPQILYTLYTIISM